MKFLELTDFFRNSRTSLDSPNCLDFQGLSSSPECCSRLSECLGFSVFSRAPCSSPDSSKFLGFLISDSS